MVKNPPANARDKGDTSSIPESGRIPGGGNGSPLPGFLPGESHGQRSLAGYSLRGHRESDMTERRALSLLLGVSREAFSESTCGIFLLKWERRALFSVSFRGGSRPPRALRWSWAVVRGPLRGHPRLLLAGNPSEHPSDSPRDVTARGPPTPSARVQDVLCCIYPE